MSVLRHALLAALCACLCVCLALPVRGQKNPTTTCLAAEGDVTGDSVSDVGYWDLIGLQSTYSTTYSVLCAFSGLYLNGPAGTNVLQYGPWHGNSTDVNCGDVFVSKYAQSTERGLNNAGGSASRTNPATGGTVYSSFKISGACDSTPSNFICAGLCPGQADYDEQMAELQQDPTFTITDYSASTSKSQAAPPPGLNVVTTLNSTQVTGPVQRKSSPYTIGTVSAVTSFQKCVGPETLVCSQSVQSAN